MLQSHIFCQRDRHITLYIVKFIYYTLFSHICVGSGTFIYIALYVVTFIYYMLVSHIYLSHTFEERGYVPHVSLCKAAKLFLSASWMTFFVKSD